MIKYELNQAADELLWFSLKVYIRNFWPLLPVDKFVLLQYTP